MKWLYRKPNLQRIVLGKGNASQVIMRYKNGKYNCYQDGFFGKTECQEHFSVTSSASGDIIIRMRNISDAHFGRYLISVYRGPDDKIDTIWIIVYKKGKLSTFCCTLEYLICAVSRGCNRCLITIITKENKPSEQCPKSNGTVETNISHSSEFTVCWNTYFHWRSLIENSLHY